MHLDRVAGSFRDPAGHVLQDDDGNIYRAISKFGLEQFEDVWKSGYLQKLIKQNWLIEANEVEQKDTSFDSAPLLLKHKKVPVVTYPYEWCFEGLKEAALLHLSIQIDALENGFVLSDASAYNVQFLGTSPVFIDHLSFRNYVDGEFWLAHNQFIEQFLCPLLLRSNLGIEHNSWYRGNLEGISTNDLSKIIPLRQKLSKNMLFHLILPTYFQNNSSTGQDFSNVNNFEFPKKKYFKILADLKDWIQDLNPKGYKSSVWKKYEDDRLYESTEVEAKHEFISEFLNVTKPEHLIDIGCNAGEFSSLALENQCNRVTGMDYDGAVIDIAFKRAKLKNKNFLPLVIDFANPSPAQGWNYNERVCLEDRCKGDALLSLAFVHHMVLGKYVPLENALRRILKFAPKGVIEFVPLDDPTVKIILKLKKIHHEYTLEMFQTFLNRHARVVKSQKITDSGRVLFWYEEN